VVQPSWKADMLVATEQDVLITILIG